MKTLIVIALSCAALCFGQAAPTKASRTVCISPLYTRAAIDLDGAQLRPGATVYAERARKITAPTTFYRPDGTGVILNNVTIDMSEFKPLKITPETFTDICSGIECCSLLKKSPTIELDKARQEVMQKALDYIAKMAARNPHEEQDAGEFLEKMGRILAGSEGN